MNLSPRHDPDAHADVCLLLEGTYPYVRGGVSTWVKQIIEGMPELRFSIVYLGAVSADHGEPTYALPDNLVHIEVHYLMEAAADGAAARPSRRLRQRDAGTSFARSRGLHERLRAADEPIDAAVTETFAELLSGPAPITDAELLHGRESWNAIRERYAAAPAGLDFNHYFWTLRCMHAPLFTLSAIARRPPKADLYHSIFTRYAGFLGALLQGATGRPYVISEHGIYTKERELDLAQVDWIPRESDPFKVGLNDGMGHLRATWIRFFHSLGRMSYASADRTFTLHEGDRLRQISDGAEERKLSIIPNGVDVRRFRPHRRADVARVPPVLALMGRVVPIKDIKTFVRAMRIVCSRIPAAEGWLIGPEDEAPAYTRECKLLVGSLGLGDAVRFLGFQRPEEIFPRVGLCVLSSISEGQPLVVLEGFAAGIPAVTTDVGSCRELVHGNTAEDRRLGSAGAVVPIANPAALAEAALALLGDEGAWSAARDATIARVETYYDERDMIERYRTVYADTRGSDDVSSGVSRRAA